ncbi:MAG: cyclopropane-fatty-acyl-phospholipid synthase, partial [Gammaproteobacteria bacterium]|nr:cyclopropane-fatty-acyl-phospholipid synthase [Gammaproteobacteria bacterium]
MKKFKGAPLRFPAAGGNGAIAAEKPAATSHVMALDRALVRRLLHTLDNPPINVILWNGEEQTGSQSAPVARVWIRDRKAFFKVLTRPDLHFGDLYSAGRIAVEGSLVQLMEIINRASRNSAHIGIIKKYLAHPLNRSRASAQGSSRDNIHHHYDLSNNFYKLWLDKEMQYTCAYFPDPAMTLDAAQLAKMDHVGRKVQLKPGDTVVEAGCGWGGLARHMARHFGVKVKAYNISHEQIVYARERANTEGLADRIEYIEDDYRNITGKYDAFVSVGMLEHVGLAHYGELGEVIHRSLTDVGRGLIHTIGRNRPGFMNAWTERRIFPGAHPPSLREMMDIFEPREFSVLDVENLRPHYAKTLEHWLERYEQHVDQVSSMFDQDFVRAWRLYLSASIAAFTTGSLQLFQITFARPLDTSVPWT